MARVYILTLGTGDDECIVGVFATIGAAESARIEHCFLDRSGIDEYEIGRVREIPQNETVWYSAEIRSPLLGIGYINTVRRDYSSTQTSWIYPSLAKKDGFPIKIGTCVSADHLKSLADEIVKAHIATWPE
jgi:hypothetical protein